MKLLIKDVLLKNVVTDILVEGNKVSHIGEIEDTNSIDKIIDGHRKAAIPTFINGHTHSAMTLFRGYADDMSLEHWLQEKIWPNEANLTDEFVYWGSRLACLEMIKSGTTLFHDMYWHIPATVQAVEDSGIRAVLSTVLMNTAGKKQGEALKAEAQHMIRQKLNSRIRLSIAPHAIYTVDAELLQWAKSFADAHNILLHIHLSETKTEVENSKKNFGYTPVEYLHSLGVLGANTVAAHCVWLTDRDIELLSAARAKVIYNPNSNLKLASGFNFRYKDLKKADVLIGLGTDGCSSSNNLDMVEAMKMASLLSKVVHDDPTAMPVKETFDLATKNSAEIFNLPLGEIKEGNLADICLVDLQRPDMTPCHHLLSNIIYSSNGSCIDTVICDGQIIMENRKVKDEELILEKASESAMKLFYE
ncbi:MAG: amidohydrolase [Bacteroidales bacterium]|jgi:5-methylthioadenosine/S-adenosylhomocysteine deaminase|nr:amidohydrolase [Bacteroidales bacterium]